MEKRCGCGKIPRAGVFLIASKEAEMRKKSLEQLLEEIDLLKRRLDALRPLSREMASELRKYYRLSLTYSYNTLEGNVLDLSETKVVVENGLTVHGKPLRDHLEAVGCAEAVDSMFEIASRKRPITEGDIKRMHYLFYVRIDPKEAGKYRRRNVVITGTEYVPPDWREVPARMSALIKNINAEPPVHPVCHVADVHGEFEKIHPFTDGNGRVGRLLASLMSLRYGYTVILIPPVRRYDYIAALRAFSERGNRLPLRTLFAECLLEEMKSSLRVLEKLSPAGPQAQAHLGSENEDEPQFPGLLC